MLIIINRIRGVTLIELMLAVTISSILMLGVGSIYFNSKRTYQLQEEFAHMQEGSRIAMRFMIEDIRSAGYLGCVWNNNPDFANFLDDDGDPVANNFTGNFLVGIEGMEASASGPGDNVDLTAPAAGWNRAIPAFITRAPLAGSDILIVRHAAGDGYPLAINNDATNVWLDDLGDPNINNATGNDCHDATDTCVGHIIMLTDCQKSRLFQVTGMTVTAQGIQLEHDDGTAGGIEPGNGEPVWGGGADEYPIFEVADTHAYTAVSHAYYIANNNDGVPCLYRQLMKPASQPEELIEGVENMQVLYGIDTNKTAANANNPFQYDGIANRYVTANLVNVALDNVVSTRISLLFRTNNEVFSKSQVAPVAKNYTLAGMSAATGTVVSSPADRRLRKVFTTTVKIRSKGVQ